MHFKRNGKRQMIDWTNNKNNVILAEQFYNELILPNKDKFNNSLFL